MCKGDSLVAGFSRAVQERIESVTQIPVHHNLHIQTNTIDWKIFAAKIYPTFTFIAENQTNQIFPSPMNGYAKVRPAHVPFLSSGHSDDNKICKNLTAKKF